MSANVAKKRDVRQTFNPDQSLVASVQAALAGRSAAQSTRTAPSASDLVTPASSSARSSSSHEAPVVSEIQSPRNQDSSIDSGSFVSRRPSAPQVPMSSRASFKDAS